MGLAEDKFDAPMTLTPNSADFETLPDFKYPPVSEVALSLQFESLSKLKGPVVGLLWGKFKERYPSVEEHPPLEPVIEKFGAQQSPNVKIQVQLFDAPPPSRAWFISKDGRELIQVQQDRFVHNWRKVGENDEYPRYSKLKSLFLTELELFRDFVAQEQLGNLIFNQAEITFVNMIVAGEGWERHGQLDNVLTIHSGNYSDDFFKEPENVQTAIRYVIPGPSEEPLGRLHISVVPAVHLLDYRSAFNLTIIARCRPDGSLEDAINCLDIAHRWVVKGFASITTKEMHRVWGRKDK